jgi:hypothetical protein
MGVHPMGVPLMGVHSRGVDLMGVSPNGVPLWACMSQACLSWSAFLSDGTAIGGVVPFSWYMVAGNTLANLHVLKELHPP